MVTQSSTERTYEMKSQAFDCKHKLQINKCLVNKQHILGQNLLEKINLIIIHLVQLVSKDIEVDGRDTSGLVQLAVDLI